MLANVPASALPAVIGSAGDAPAEDAAQVPTTPEKASLIQNPGSGEQATTI
jgi:hypothetical protein